LAARTISTTRTLNSVPGLDVTVTNAATGEPICDAAVIARDGAYSTTLDPARLPCHYIGADERPGSYQIEVSRPTFRPTAVTAPPVVLESSGCHVVEVNVAVALQTN
jgi:hypothetical protein